MTQIQRKYQKKKKQKNQNNIKLNKIKYLHSYTRNLVKSKSRQNPKKKKQIK